MAVEVPIAVVWSGEDGYNLSIMSLLVTLQNIR